MDQTALRSAMGRLTRLGIVVETISNFAPELARLHPVLQALIVETYAEADGPAHQTALTEMRSIDLTAPARTAKGGFSGRLTLEDFSRDEAGLVLECPSGVAPVSTFAASAKLQARFDLATGRECPDRGRSPVQADTHDGQCPVSQRDALVCKVNASTKGNPGPNSITKATTLGAFVPMLFWPGIIGKFMF